MSKSVLKKKLMSAEQLESARREPTIHQIMKHRSVVRLHEYTETDEEIRMFMEHMNMADYLVDKIEEVLSPVHVLGRGCDHSRTRTSSDASSLKSSRHSSTSTPKVSSTAT